MADIYSDRATDAIASDRRLQWLNHEERMEEERTGKRVGMWGPEPRKKMVGRCYHGIER